MKRRTSFLNVTIFTFLSIFFGTNISIAQDSVKNKKVVNELAVTKMLEDRNFIFVATFVSPMRGTRRYLDPSHYDLQIRKDSMICYLPYFGRAYTAPISSTDIMFDFTSSNFEYSSGKNKKGVWDISIKPKDNAGVQQIFLTVYSNGSSQLNINSANRDPISFEGYITQPKPDNP